MANTHRPSWGNYLFHHRKPIAVFAALVVGGGIVEIATMLLR